MKNDTRGDLADHIFTYHGGNNRPGQSRMLSYSDHDVQIMVHLLYSNIGAALECTHNCVIDFVRVETYEE